MDKESENVDVVEEDSRRIHIIVKAADCPGFLSHLNSLPHGAEGPLIRAILFDWFSKQKRAGTLDATVAVFLENLKCKKRSRIMSAMQPVRTKTNRSCTPMLGTVSEMHMTPFVEAQQCASPDNASFVSNQKMHEESEVRSPTDRAVGQASPSDDVTDADFDLMGAIDQLVPPVVQ